MFIGNIDELVDCRLLNNKAIRLIKEFINLKDLKSLTKGKYDLDNENFINILEYDTKESDNIFESHKRYIDVHYLILGKEKLKWININKALPKGEYNCNGDYQLYSCNEDRCAEIVPDNRFIVLGFDDVHKAGISIGDISKVKKAVFKIKL
jgi:YhcH/YjgK/YiaL family protein